MQTITTFFLAALCLFLPLCDGIRTNFSFSFAEWAMRLVPFLAVLGLSVLFLSIGPDAVPPAVGAALFAMLDVMLAMCPESGNHSLMFCIYVLTLSVVVAALAVLNLLGHVSGEACMVAVCFIPPASSLAAFTAELFRKHSVPNLAIQNVTIWASVHYCSQLLCNLGLSVILMALLISCWIGDTFEMGFSIASLVILAPMSVYFYWKNSLGTPFLLRSRHAKKTHKSSSSPKTDKKSQDERMVELYKSSEEYMQKNQPYLDYSFTLSDLAGALCVNKTLLSKTINKLSGNNFCQYVNKYRVDYAISLMKQDPARLKVTEVAIAAGFNSVVSFNMAFRLFLDDTPSEYMRTLRAKSLERGY